MGNLPGQESHDLSTCNQSSLQLHVSLQPFSYIIPTCCSQELPSQVGLISGGEDHQGLVRSPIDPIQLTIVNHQCKLNTPIPEMDCYFLMCVIVCVCVTSSDPGPARSPCARPAGSLPAAQSGAERSWKHRHQSQSGCDKMCQEILGDLRAKIGCTKPIPQPKYKGKHQSPEASKVSLGQSHWF